MGRRLRLCLALLVLSGLGSARAQDVITLRDSSTVAGQVLGVTSEFVYYRLGNLADTTAQQLPLGRLARIRFGNGAVQLVPPPDGEWLPGLRRSPSVDSLRSRVAGLAIALPPGPGSSQGLSLVRPLVGQPHKGADRVASVCRAELGATTLLKDLPNTPFGTVIGVRALWECPVFPTLVAHQELLLGLALQARIPWARGAAADTLRPARLLEQPQLLPFLTLGWRQYLSPRFCAVVRAGLSPGRVQRVPVYDSFDRTTRYEYQAYGAWNSLIGLSLAWPFSSRKPTGLGLSLGVELYGNSFQTDATAYRQQIGQVSFGLAF